MSTDVSLLVVMVVEYSFLVQEILRHMRTGEPLMLVSTGPLLLIIMSLIGLTLKII